jgi:ABC-2 type transport system ATP-binding protein
MEAAIRTKGLGKTYLSGFWRIPFVGLKGLDLEVPEGTSFGFVGPNGAGKTTTIKILMGLQSMTTGDGWIHGVSIKDPASRKRVGFLPERPYFYEHLTAGEFLDFYGRLCEVPSAERAKRVERLLERVDLARFRDVGLGKFSKGMLQRAGLAQALMGDPDLLVLDEPMSGLDPIGRVLVRDIIVEERRAGKTVFFSSHILADIEAICDRAAIVVRGQCREQGLVRELVGRTIEYVDCEILGAKDLVLPPGVEARIREPGRLVLRMSAEAVDPMIDAARAAGGSVLSVQPHARTLEQVLLDEVERARPVDKKHLGVLA